MSSPTAPKPVSPRRALVLGGGGLTGIGWETGLLKGLLDMGVDLTTADTLVGTSAGSVVATQLSVRPLDVLYAAQLQPAHKELGARFSPAMALRAGPAWLAPGSPATRRRRLGAAAARAHRDPEARVQVIRHRLQIDGWPERDLRITAINTSNGELTVFNRDSGVDVVEAVAASCAVPMVWPTVEINGEHFMDGGVRSPINADVAWDATEAVVIIAPMARGISKDGRVRDQLARLSAKRHVMITPDAESLKAFGRNPLDPAKRSAAARAGLREAKQVAEQIQAVWG